MIKITNSNKKAFKKIRPYIPEEEKQEIIVEKVKDNAKAKSKRKTK